MRCVSQAALLLAGFALAVPDVPSDQRTLSLALRGDPWHATDIAGVMQDARKRLPCTRVLLLGDTASGTSCLLVRRRGRGRLGVAQVDPGTLTVDPYQQRFVLR